MIFLYSESGGIIKYVAQFTYEFEKRYTYCLKFISLSQT